MKGVSSVKSVSNGRFFERPIEDFLAVIIAGITAFFFTLQSPIHLWSTAASGTDSSVFQTVAMMMQRGVMPYSGSFDHKGILLYFINWLGRCIRPGKGVWVIEVLFLAVTFYMLYKIARLVCGRGASCVVTFLSISLLFGSYDGGNCSEEYALVFIAIATYIFVDYLRNDRISIWRYMICGACLGCALLLRPNMIGLWIVMCVGILIRFIVLKAWRQLGFAVLWFVAGLAVVLVPALVWLGVKHDLGSFWESYIVFNMKYASNGVGLNLFQDKWSAFFHFFNSTVFIAAVAALGFAIKGVPGGSARDSAGGSARDSAGDSARDSTGGSARGAALHVIFLVYLVLTLIFVGMSGMTYPHYGMILVPAVTYPLALIFGWIDVLERKVAWVVTALVSVLALSTIVAPAWLDLLGTVPKRVNERYWNWVPETEQQVVSLVQEYTQEDEAISVFGNWDIIYVLSDRPHATRFSYQDPPAYVVPSLMEEYFTQLQEELPEVIVVQAGHFDEKMKEFLARNSYARVWTEDREMDAETFAGAQVWVLSAGLE